MSRRDWIGFTVLAALWGASYMFIKVALDDVFSPAWVVFSRTALAALLLLPFALRRGALAGLRPHLPVVALLAAVQVAAPFMLISEGERHIDSSLAGILVATAPIFTYLLAIRFDSAERVHGVALAGVVIGIVGVVLLLGVDAGGSSSALLGGLLVVVAATGYAAGAFMVKRRLGAFQPIGVVAAAMAASAVMLAPAAAVSVPESSPSLEALASLAALGALGTGVSFVIFYTLIGSIGPARTSLVAYVAPVFAVFYGAVLLDESLGISTFVGLVLILGGSWLAAEGRLPGRRTVVAAEGAAATSQTSTSERSTAMTATSPTVTIRRSTVGDAVALGRLAQLDSTLYPGGDYLVAELDGGIVAALPLAGGPAFSDPFVRTLEIVAMLALRREQLHTAGAGGQPVVRRALRAVRRPRRYRAHASA